MTGVRTRLAASAVTIAVLAIAIPVGLGWRGSNVTSLEAQPSVEAPRSNAPHIRTLYQDPTQPTYPSSWEVSPSDLSKSVGFSVIVPDNSFANVDNMTNAYVMVGGASVAMDFPAPAVAKDPITQEYLEVWEAPWEGGDPEELFKQDVAADPVTGKQLTSIDGVTALSVSAHSPDKDVVGHANPAFLKFVIDGVEVQISGGEDLGVLISIATSMIENSG